MPIRVKNEAMLAYWIDGFIAVDDEELKSQIGNIYTHFIRSVDWNRVVIEAQGRCLKLHKHLADYDIPCADCIEAVMFLEQTFPDWDNSLNAQIAREKESKDGSR